MKEIASFGEYVAQLTQSISEFALEPTDLRDLEKGWWQFWK